MQCSIRSGEDAVAVVVPAMPQSRRILVGGYSVIDGVALINTPVAKDVHTRKRKIIFHDCWQDRLDARWDW